MKNNYYCDTKIWNKVCEDDLWIFDKLIVSKKLGYVCGPKGVNVPEPGLYVARPCVNLMGMGRGARFVILVDETDYLITDGTFWSQVFKGKHLSVDYYKGEQKLCVEGIRSDISNIQKWDMWKKVKDKMPYPNILNSLKGNYDWVNVEFIGDKIIEIHLRRNPDFKDHNADCIIPVYAGEEIKDKPFIKSVDSNRVGFYLQEGDNND